ncbi:MAG: helix-turn-helix transcriptional regulator [Desulfovibrionaceae bacterium]|nr:helix-turn-helix transcriptional regulator [Desulfovibrionaceae bacterium]
MPLKSNWWNYTTSDSTMQDLPQGIAGIPDRLREVIGQSGLSQTKFADAIGVPPQQLKDVLRGQIKPPSHLVTAVASTFDVDVMWLLSGRSLDVGELAPLEKILIENYRSLSETDKNAARRLVAAMAESIGHAKPASMLNTGANAVQIGHAGGDVTVDQGKATARRPRKPR